MQTIRQSDVLFIPVQPSRLDIHAISNKEDFCADGIIQEGEATGHHHRIADLESAEVFRPEHTDAFVRVGPNGVSIVHEEHGPVTLAPNTVYRVHIAREFDYLANAMRYVAD